MQIRGNAASPAQFTTESTEGHRRALISIELGADADARLGMERLRGNHPTRTAPPFTLKISPVIKPARGVQRNRIGPAISWAVAARPTGIFARIASRVSGSLRA